MSNGRSLPGRHTLVLAVALAGLAAAFSAATWAADPAPAAAAESGATSKAVKAPARHESASPVATASATAGTDPVATEKWALLDKYCSKCHNATDWAGGVAFDTMSAGSIPEDAETWEK